VGWGGVRFWCVRVADVDGGFENFFELEEW